ncbi:MAG TPA: hypothetical protein ENN05_04910 [Deltaproteobacteria bacterium]|nr:hypothetical protein [Deltaproteobacteria bacterium]
MQYRMMKFILMCLRVMPYRPVIIFGRSLGLLAWILDPYHRKTAAIRNDPRLESIINDIRSRSGATILPPKGKALMLIKELRKGSTIGMIVNQRGKRGEKLFCNIFGLPAPTNPAPAFIAIKGNALVLPVYALKQGDTYHVRFFPAADALEFGTGTKAIKGAEQPHAVMGGLGRPAIP